MSNDVLVSILMPVKNTAVFLPECLDSIIAQTATNWELIVIDDHSTDKSYTVLLEYAKKDKRIKPHRNNGVGIIAALRLAFDKSTGTLITRMDSDDVMHNDKLNVLQQDLLKEGRGSVALGLVSYFSEKPLGEGYQNYELWLNKLTTSGSNFNEIYKECVIPSPCWMIHRDDLEKCGAFYPDRYPEDYDLCFRFYEKGMKSLRCNKVLHYWRDYPERTSRNHEHYADNGFLDIKEHYFFKLNYDENRPLILWGAGKKGKTMAKKIIERKEPFYWICDNPKKIGKEIYGQILTDNKSVEDMRNPQHIITVANPTAQKEIITYFKSRGSQPMKDYFFFC